MSYSVIDRALVSRAIPISAKGSINYESPCIYIWLLGALQTTLGIRPGPLWGTSVPKTPCAHPDFRAWLHYWSVYFSALFYRKLSNLRTTEHQKVKITNFCEKYNILWPVLKIMIKNRSHATQKGYTHTTKHTVDHPYVFSWKHTNEAFCHRLMKT